MKPAPAQLRVRSRFGKYRILRRCGEGGFATVFEAIDSIEGIRVAVKVPHPHLVDDETLKLFRREARIHASLDHPNIVPIKTAEVIDGRFAIVYPLGQRSLAERMRRRMSTATFLVLARQMLEAVAHAHDRRIIHCDLKPENFLLFEGQRVRLTDFSIAKVALRTMRGSGSGTVGYVAPEQALGRASFRSDVFSLGLILWEMLTGELPEWPFKWPPPGMPKLRRRLPAEFVQFLRKALDMQPARRYADARRMAVAFRKLVPKVQRFTLGGTRRTRKGSKPPSRSSWDELRHRACLREHRRTLGLDRACNRCDGPMAEAMACCPWCGEAARRRSGETALPAQCPRCGSGRKLDWRFCAHCYGGGFDEVSERHYPDRRYVAKCGSCKGQLMKFSRYCPWCRRKVTRQWKIEGVTDKCRRCNWGIVADLWQHCPWCTGRIPAR